MLHAVSNVFLTKVGLLKLLRNVGEPNIYSSVGIDDIK